MNNNLQELYNSVTSTNLLYTDNQKRWLFYLESYMGGDEYRGGNHLNRYQLESDREYKARLAVTPLDNHCRSVINVYNSFLFREEPERDFGDIKDDPLLVDFLYDADLEGRSLDAVMKDVATWTAVFGHSYILLSKPNIGAETLADEQAAGVRPYISVLTPLVVYDWTYERSPNGYYRLTYFKYAEDDNNRHTTKIIEWYEDRIVTSEMNRDKKKIIGQIEEVNQLGMIPIVIAYNQRSPIKGIGVSDISDIADQQKAIYNELSEIEASIRLDSHPTLVTPENVKLGSGAGAVCYVPETLDPGLRPYLLQNSGADINAIYASIAARIASIDKMANTGAVRATEARTMSGIAMQTEFALLNARLAEKADNLEIAEEQMWKIWSAYQGQTWNGEIEYPGSFNIHDVGNEFQQLQSAKTTATTPDAIAVIEYRLRELLDDPRYTITEEEAFEMPEYQAEIDAINAIAAEIRGVQTPSTAEPASPVSPGVDGMIQQMIMDGLSDEQILAQRPELTQEDIIRAKQLLLDLPTEGFNQASCPVATQDVAVNLANRQKAIDVANYGPLNPSQTNTVFWLAKADMWNVSPVEAKTSRCGNCAAFNVTAKIKDCINAGLSAGGATGDEYDTIAAGELGYCEAFDFKCASSRTCDAWVTGGPITD